MQCQQRVSHESAILATSHRLEQPAHCTERKRLLESRRALRIPFHGVHVGLRARDIPGVIEINVGVRACDDDHRLQVAPASVLHLQCHPRVTAALVFDRCGTVS